MLRKMTHKRSRRVIIVSLCAGAILSGCGTGTPKSVEDYGGTSSETVTTEYVTEETTGRDDKSTSESIDIRDARTGNKLSDWLGGKELKRENDFSVGKYPASSLLTFNVVETPEEMQQLMETGYGLSATMDTDELTAWRATGVTKESIREAEIVENLLGSTAKEIKGTVSLGAGDAELIVDTCRDFIGRYDTSSQGDDAFYQEFDNPDHPWQAWSDGGDYFWHTYEGKYLDMDYQLVIGYLGEYHQKVISFYPKNPGDLVGAPELSRAKQQESGQVQIETEDNQWEWKSLEELGAKKKEVSQNRETLQKEAESFVEKELFAKLHDIQVNDTNLLFYNETFDGKDYSNTIIGGVCASINWEFNNQEVYTDEYSIANIGQIWLTDEGVIGIRAYIGWNFEECLSEQVAIMSFDTAMETLEEQIANNLDVTKVTASTLTIRQLRFCYYPVESPKNPNEYTFIPAWIAGIISGNGANNGYYLGDVVMNAIDGSLIEIKYSE